MLSSNLRSSVPKLPLDVFADLAYVNPENGNGDFYYSAGLAIPIARTIFEIYIPILESDAILSNHDAQGREGIWERVTFRLNLNRLNILDVTDNLGL
jgi:hypothetical protein